VSRAALGALGLALAACGDDERARDTSATDIDVNEIGDAATTDSGDGDGADAEVTPAPPWYEGAFVYEIFVRSFQDSDGDGVGDLRGIVNRLDYLNDGVPGAGDDLEVDALWLMPIFASGSYHGSDVTDYEAIEPDYGTLADFDALVAACEARGVRVVIDLVMNHTGRTHPWFLASSSSASDPKRDWYVWRGDDPGWKQPFGNADVWHALGGAYYYGIFWSGMPDLNYREPGVVAAMTDIARGWLGRGVAGFRLDAARYLIESADGGLFEQPETHAFWRAFRADLEARGDAYLVGEVWTSRPAVATYWGEGEELHQAFDFALQSAILSAVSRGQASWLRPELAAVRDSGAPWGYSATFLSNHDLDRLSLELDDGQQRAAAFVLMTLPGTPYLYYGDELGVKTTPAAGDLAKRGPMPWTAAARHGFSTAAPWVAFGPEAESRNVEAALADPDSLLRMYQALARLRRAHPALRGPGVVAPTHAEPALFATLRHAEGEVVLTAVNLSGGAIAATTLDLSAQDDITGGAPWDSTPLFGQDAGGRVTDPAAVPIPELAPYEGRVWRLVKQPDD